VIIPHRFVLKTGRPFAFAGLWDEWKTPLGEPLLSFTIITTGPNELMKPIHDRMPVILHKEDEDLWLNTSMSDEGKLLELLRPYDSKEMKQYEVSVVVNSPRQDGPECIVPSKNADKQKSLLD
jgi:putative SOS response-associated peptidase YedK